MNPLSANTGEPKASLFDKAPGIPAWGEVPPSKALIEEAAEIFRRANDLRLFLPRADRRSNDARRVLAEAHAWLCRVLPMLSDPAYPAGQVLDLTEPYDLLHRTYHGIPADPDLIAAVRMRAYRQRLDPDSHVDIYALYRAVSAEQRRGNAAFLTGPLRWSSATLGRWYRQALRRLHRPLDPDAMPPRQLQDEINQIKILLREDLYAFTPNQDPFKQLLKGRLHLLRQASPQPIAN